jgi:hypothetical protein
MPSQSARTARATTIRTRVSIMKTKSRIRQNGASRAIKPQAKSRSPITLGAVRIGEAIGLSNKEIKALALIAAWENETPAEYTRSIFTGFLQSSYDDMVLLSRANDRPQEKAWAGKFIHRAAPLFPPARRGGIPDLAPSRISNSKKSIAGGVR